MESKVNNSFISPDAIIYRFTNVDNSSVNQKCIIGDFSRVVGSNLSAYVKIDRFNLIYHTIIGEYTYTGSYDVIMHTTIGKFCSISWGVTIGPGNHDYQRLSSHDFLYNDRYGIKKKDSVIPYNRFEDTCTIGNDVWIGANSTILRGVTLHDGAVIGANSIVTKDVPPYAIVVGNPAKIIRYRFDEEIIKKLLEIQWWNFPIEKIKDKYSAFAEENINIAIEKLNE